MASKYVTCSEDSYGPEKWSTINNLRGCNAITSQGSVYSICLPPMCLLGQLLLQDITCILVEMRKLTAGRQEGRKQKGSVYVRSGDYKKNPTIIKA